MATMQQILEATGFNRYQPDVDPRLVQPAVPSQYTVAPPPPPGPMINRNANQSTSNVSRRTIPSPNPSQSGMQIMQALRTIFGQPDQVQPTAFNGTMPEMLPDDPEVSRADMFGGGGMEVPERKDAPSRAEKLAGKDKASTDASTARVASNSSGIPGLTPYPTLNNPGGLAAWFARSMFGTVPGKPGAPPIADNLASAADVPSSAGPPPVGQALASTPAQQPSSRGGSGSTIPAGAPSVAASSAGRTPPPSQSGPLLDPTMQKFLLQMGLSMMTPKWGGPLANIASSIGEGAEAVSRGRKEKQDSDMAERKLAAEEARIAKIGRGSSSSSKSLKAKTPIQQLSENMTPEASLYFQQRLKNLKGEVEVTDAEGNVTNLSESEQFNRLMQETKAIDARTRAAAGRAKSAEINDANLSKYVGTPREAEVLNFVANDPVERALLVQRMENMKRAKAAANANTGTAPKQ